MNNDGKVIGMVTFAYSTQYAQNLNFAISRKEIRNVISSYKNEEASVSKTLQKIYALKSLALKDVLKRCKSYRVDEDRDGTTDYISLNIQIFFDFLSFFGRYSV